MQRPHGNRAGERPRRADVVEELRLQASKAAAVEETLALAALERERHKHRQTWTKDEKMAILGEYRSRNSSMGEFCDEWTHAHPGKTLSSATLNRWSCQFPQGGPQTATAIAAAAAVASRGRRFMLLPPEVQYVLDNVESYRTRFIAVSTGAVQVWAMKAIDHTRPGLLPANIAAKQLLMSRSWARRFLVRHDYRMRKRTGDRTVPMETIVDAAPPFYDKIRALGAVATNPRLWFNMDEFCVTLDENANWTWTRTVDSKNVHIRSCKIALTASILTNAAGEALLLQLIWGGTTARVEVSEKCMRHLDQRIMQCESESHFQTAATFALWTKRVVRIVDGIRRECGTPDARAVLLIDHAPQHMADGSHELQLLKGSNVDHVFVPEKMTHVFQPADMFVISCLKKKTRALWEEHLANATGDVSAERRQAAVDRYLEQSRPMARLRKVAIMSGALKELSPEAVQLSWWMTGIVRELDQCNLDWTGVHRFPIPDEYADNCYIDQCRRTVQRRRDQEQVVVHGDESSTEHNDDDDANEQEEGIIEDADDSDDVVFWVPEGADDPQLAALAAGQEGAVAQIADDEVRAQALETCERVQAANEAARVQARANVAIIDQLLAEHAAEEQLKKDVAAAKIQRERDAAMAAARNAAQQQQQQRQGWPERWPERQRRSSSRACRRGSSATSGARTRPPAESG